MKPVLLQDTPAYQFGVRPAVIPRDMTSMMVSDVVKAMNQTFKAKNLFQAHLTKDNQVEPKGYVDFETPMGDPERDAVVFYMMNHAASVIRSRYHPYQSLGSSLALVEEYHRQLAFRATRMFFYILIICTRESRHDKSSYTGTVWAKHIENYGEACQEFHASIKGKGSSEAADRLRTKPPKMTLGAYTSFLVDCFYKGTFSGGYGGKAWGAVADVLRDYVHGKLTAEMMLDTSFTLCHNNGPIFNKGMLYETYSHHIYQLLDVQRSGQIPQMVANGETKWASDPVVKELFKLCQHHLPEEFSGYVDWYMVEKLGALNSYPNEKQKQVIKHGMPDHVEPEKPVKDEGPGTWSNATQTKVKIKTPFKPLTSLEIMPGLYVQKSKVRPS